MTDASPSWIINADIDGRICGCRIEGGRITALGPAVVPSSCAAVFDAQGGGLIPGLVDHHIHLYALAAARTSLDIAGHAGLSEVVPPTGDGWVRATGADTAWTLRDLDRAFPDRPVRVQHRSGAMWMLNSVAIQRLGAELSAAERASGRLWRADSRLRHMLARVGESSTLDFASIGSDLARFGVTQVTDATPDLDEVALARLREALPQRIGSLSAHVASRLPVKVIVPDHELPPFDDLVDRFKLARRVGRSVAVHAVSAVAVALAISALEEVGPVPGDRIEHAAVCSDAAADRIAELGVTVVTQPGLWRRREREFVADTPEAERPFLWRHGSLRRRGVRVAVATDAPYGDADPWHAIHAAATRSAIPGGEDERVAPGITMASLLAHPASPAGPSQVLRVGEIADMAVLRAPLADVCRALERSPEPPVLATFVSGRQIV
jgi:predicted amidohydrolase YtcJ